MWKLTHVSASNFVSFKELDLELTQGVATLLYGINKDNENQKNNGTGKSSLLEIIAFGITGDSIKKVPNTNDIINNYEEEASVCLSFLNDYNGKSFRIERYISRSQPQRIELFEGTPGDGEKAIVLSSVLEYGKYILDVLGLTKDDIYGCFLLNSARFKSFFVASDKEKKDIINNFSNGVVVDEAIDKLHEDMEPVSQQLTDAKMEVARSQGAVEAIVSQIQATLDNQENEANQRNERINNIKEEIANKRVVITQNEEAIEKVNERIDKLQDVKDKLAKLQETDISITESYRKIKEMFQQNCISAIEDYDSKVAITHAKIEQFSESLSETKKLAEKAQKDYKEYQEQYESVRDLYIKAKNATDVMIPDIDKHIEELNNVMDNIENAIAEYEASISKYNKDIDNIDATINRLNIKINGSITCPKCGYQFVVETDGDNVSVEELKDLIKTQKTSKEKHQDQISEIKGKIAKMDENFDKYDLQVVDMKKEKKRLRESLDVEYAKLTEAKHKLSEFADEQVRFSRELDSLERDKNMYVSEVENMCYKMFSQANTNVDKAISNENICVSSYKTTISSQQGSIDVLLKSIEDLKNFDATGVVDQLKARKKELDEDLEGARAIESSRQHKYDELVAQEDYFVRFKSYLANTKIESIADLTNSFLQQIGSDMSVELSGYKVLKSKKVREKITVSVLRNGEDTGAFEKLSAGERCRIVLAGILAMRQLTNANCEDGKGLDLLIIDELMDASDYPGLMSYADAINSLGITTLMVTQNVVSESYPYRLVVQKEGGISTIINKE